MGEVLNILVGGRHGDALQCAARGDGFVVSGTARVVPGAAQADRWLVAADDEAGTWRVLQVSPQAAGVAVSTYRMMDGRQAADVSFDAVTVPAAGPLARGRGGRSGARRGRPTRR